MNTVQDLSVEEYFRLEEGSPIQHEYIAGVLFAMTSPTIRHDVISTNVFGALMAHLRGGPCRPFIANVKVGLTMMNESGSYSKFSCHETP